MVHTLQASGIKKTLINWIQALLTDIKHRIGIHGQKASWTEVTSGVPQGFVLGPLLFLMYINDMEDELDSQLFMFSDDHKLFRVLLNAAYYKEQLQTISTS